MRKFIPGERVVCIKKGTWRTANRQSTTGPAYSQEVVIERSLLVDGCLYLVLVGFGFAGYDAGQFRPLHYLFAQEVIVNLNREPALV